MFERGNCKLLLPKCDKIYRGEIKTLSCVSWIVKFPLIIYVKFRYEFEEIDSIKPIQLT